MNAKSLTQLRNRVASLQKTPRKMRMRDITVTVVAMIVIISRIVLTVITQAPWSFSVTGRSGGRRTVMLDDMVVERFSGIIE